jgi:hypothetical protein
MQTDFHFYAIYALCRACGFRPGRARTVAYASQYVDDADDGRPQTLENGEIFNPVMTAHKTLSWGNFTTDVQKKIYLSFHFIPGVVPGQPAGNPRDRNRLVTTPDCPISRLLLEEARASRTAEDHLHRLGVALHTYADTWSHQGFSGFNGPENDVEVIQEKRRNPVSFLFRKIWGQIMEFVLPAIGHAEAYTNPDLPYKNWKYFDFFRRRETGRIANTERCRDAAKNIYRALGGAAWDTIEPGYTAVFEYPGNLEARCLRWKQAMAAGTLGYVPEEADRHITYAPDQWYCEALRPSTKHPGRKVKEDNFKTSDFAFFQRAARGQRQRVLEIIEQTKLPLGQAPFWLMFHKIAGFFGDLLQMEGRASFSGEALRHALFRFFVYGSLGVAGEVGFYTLVKIGRAVPLSFINWLFAFEWRVDPRLNLGAVWDTPISVLYGQASLWMFFVYGAIGLLGIESLYKRIRRDNWVFRGLAYMTVILALECASGWVLRFFLGYDIWYYTGRGVIFKYTSLAIAPLWFITGLLSENMVNLVTKYHEKKKALAALAA